MLTPTALASETRRYEGTVWRVVEAQHRISTNRLAASLEDQARLEALAEGAKIFVIGGKADDSFWSIVKRGADDAGKLVADRGGSVTPGLAR